MTGLTEIQYSATTPLATVYAAIIGAGGRRLQLRGNSEWGLFVYPIQLTTWQLNYLRAKYPRHADYLRGEAWVCVDGDKVAVGGGVHGYDSRCGRYAAGSADFEYGALSEEQKREITGLVGRIEEQLKERGGLAELAAQA